MSVQAKYSSSYGGALATIASNDHSVIMTSIFPNSVSADFQFRASSDTNSYYDTYEFTKAHFKPDSDDLIYFTGQA